MKKFAILAMCFVLMIGIMTACGSRKAEETTAPSTHATTVPTTASTKATTAPTTAPTTASTAPTDGDMFEDGKIDGSGDAGSKGNRKHRLP